jgi:hypothetical protein
VSKFHFLFLGAVVSLLVGTALLVAAVQVDSWPLCIAGVAAQSGCVAFQVAALRTA